MTWSEVTEQRTRYSRNYRDDADPALQRCSTTIKPLHYESSIGSDVYDMEIDATPVRVDNEQFDGWRITNNGWHYALGQPADKAEDGWVGFGGRQGAHWLQFHLLRVGYLHWPTRAWDDVGGSPTYDRGNLSSIARELTLAPDVESSTVEALTTWSSIWTTPGGGDLSMSWSVVGDQLKEEITINQAAREWIHDNHPPATPATETWFGFVFELDWSDVPKLLRDDVLLSIDDDFADDGLGIELRDALDQLLAFLPVSDAYVDLGKARASVQLRKRFWHDDRYYLLVGARVDMLNDMPAGDLVFDPTVNPQVEANADDALSWPVGQFNVASTHVFLGDDGDWNHSGLRFTLNVPAAATISSATLTLTSNAALAADTVRVKIHYEDANDPADFSGDDYAAFEARVRSATAYDWDFTTDWADNTEYTSANFSTVIQALVNEAYWASGEHCVVFIEDDSSDGNAHRRADSHDGSAADAAVLNVTYATAGQPMNLRGTTVPHLRQWQPGVTR